MTRLGRRDFMGGLTAAAAMGLTGITARPAGAEPPPETTRIRIAKVPAICLAPMYVAEEMLHSEGFTDVQYVEMDLPRIATSIAEGATDLSAETAPDLIMKLDDGRPLVVVAGLHVGCY